MYRDNESGHPMKPFCQYSVRERMRRIDGQQHLGTNLSQQAKQTWEHAQVGARGAVEGVDGQALLSHLLADSAGLVEGTEMDLETRAQLQGDLL
ncbi:MAG: hypothetical protein C4335_14765 [Armatimonadota bacterium]